MAVIFEQAHRVYDTRIRHVKARVTGATLLHYNIVEKLGEGGNGRCVKVRAYAPGPLCRYQGLARRKAQGRRAQPPFVQEAAAGGGCPR